MSKTNETESKTKTVLEDFKHIEYKESDILLVRTKGETLSRQMGDSLQRFAQELHARSGKNPLVLWLPESISLHQIDEKAMNQNGWQKIPGWLPPGPKSLQATETPNAKDGIAIQNGPAPSPPEDGQA